MAIYNVHAGHNYHVPGAAGVFAETSEDRAVKDLVIAKLRQTGHTVYDCTDEDGSTQAKNLSNIVNKCNQHRVDLDISIHFNASNGAGHGVEVWCYDEGTRDVAAQICGQIAALGFTNRGVKYTDILYVLSNTASPALLIECCFCDNDDDAQLYKAETMAGAIVKGLTGQSVSTPVPKPTPAPSPVPVPPATTKPEIYYAVQTLNHGKLPEVKGRTDMAGIANDAITAIKMRATSGSLKYRVHANGKWFGWVTGCSWDDYNNGYAGDSKSSIDAIQIYYNTDTAKTGGKYYSAVYQVKAYNKGSYYPNVRDTDGSNGDGTGTAGAFGTPFTQLLISLE